MLAAAVIRIGPTIASLLSAVTGVPGSPAATQPQADLRPMLRIEWRRGPNLPQGLQDSAIGIIDNTLVLAGGFCAGRGSDIPGKADKYPRGFIKKAWGLDLRDGSAKWIRLPDLPA